VGRPAWRGYRIAGGIDYEILGGITSADPSHIADVVRQCGENGMSPNAGGDGPLKTTAAQDVPNTKGNQGRVLAIVIERVDIGDALHNETSGFRRERRPFVALGRHRSGGTCPRDCVLVRQLKGLFGSA